MIRARLRPDRGTTRNRPAAGASRTRLGAITRLEAATFGPAGVRVNAVASGITATPFTESSWGADLASRVPESPLEDLLGRVALPADIAEVVAFDCPPASRSITGQVIHMSAGTIV